MPRIKVYLTDVGNVLLKLKDDEFFGRIAAASRLTPDLLQAEIAKPGGHYDRYERGLIEGTDFHAYLRGAYALTWDWAGFLARWNDFFLPNPAMNLLLENLKPQVRLWGLSNTNPEHCAHFSAVYPVLGMLEGLVSSCEVGLRKPEKAIFESALKTVGAAPGEVFYIDDALENVETARGLGLTAFHYKFNDQALADELMRMGFSVKKPQQKTLFL